LSSQKTLHAAASEPPESGNSLVEAIHMTTRRNLIILCAGDTSVHAQWLTGPERNFDLFISYFGPQHGRYANDGEYYQQQTGLKYPSTARILHEHPGLLERYTHFWLPDEDLITDTASINRLFGYAAAYQLALAQPAQTHDSHQTWPLLLHNPRYELRFTRFVEVMAPLFDRAALQICLPTFSESQSGFGLDLIWPSLLQARGERAIAIIDAAQICHSRPVGGGDLYKNIGFQEAKHEGEALLSKYGLSSDARVEARHFYGGIGYLPPGLWQRVRTWLSRRIRALNYRRLQRRARARN